MGRARFRLSPASVPGPSGVTETERRDGSGVGRDPGQEVLPCFSWT